VYRVPSGDAGAGSVARAALLYEELIKNMPPNVLGVYIYIYIYIYIIHTHTHTHTCLEAS
jgi:hypothetical protein